MTLEEMTLEAAISVPKTLLVGWPRTCNRISRGQRMPSKMADGVLVTLRRGARPPGKGIQ